MKLKRLIVQGFKSFKDKTTIHFDDGITGIVGPNGCGKSNIVDALFWVMGEQSAKHLRGQSMKDVIFAGSSKYSPATWAEVSLVLENTEKKHIHIGPKVASPSEIQLTRRLYRNGESDYRINGNLCRLKDIQEIFMDTGAGAKSYSIIAQGEINKLVSAKPQERRSMIEEVAGITKFKLRRKESLKKIEATHSNLNRLNDLKIEIDKNLKNLEKQAEKAERARQLRDRVKKNELIVSSHKVHDLLKEFAEKKNRSEELTELITTTEAHKNSLELNLEKERIKKEELHKGLDECQLSFNEYSKDLAASEERLTYSKKDLESKKVLKEKTIIEIDQIKVELEDRKNKDLELSNNLESIINNFNDYDFEGKSKLVEDLKKRLLDHNLSVDEKKTSLDDLRTIMVNSENEAFKNKNKLEEVSRTLDNLSIELEELESEFSKLSTDISNDRKEMDLLEKEMSQAKNEEDHIRNDIIKARNDFESTTKEVDELKEKKTLISSKLQSLHELNKNFEGIKKGISEFLSKGNPDGSFSLLGQSIKCDKKYALAIQNILEDISNVLISENSNIESVLDYAKKNEKNSLDVFFSCDELVRYDDFELSESLKELGVSEVIKMKDVVSFEKDHGDNRIFGGQYFLIGLTGSNLQEILKIVSGLTFKTLSDIEGRIIIRKRNGETYVSFAAPSNEASGLISRKSKIEQLKEELEIYSLEFNKLEELKNIRKTELNDLNKSYEKVVNKVMDLKVKMASKKSLIDSRGSNFNSNGTRIENLKQRKSILSNERLLFIEAEEKLTKDIEIHMSRKTELDEQYAALCEEGKGYEHNYQQEKETFLRHELEHKNFEERKKSLINQIDDVKKQIERLCERELTSAANVELLGEEVLTLEKTKVELEESIQIKVKELAVKSDQLSLIKEEMEKISSECSNIDKQIRQMQSEISSAEKEISQAKVKIEQNIFEEAQTVRDIFEKYQIDLRKSLLEFLQISTSDLTPLDDMFFMETENGRVEIAPSPFEFVRKYGKDLKECQSKYYSAKSELSRLGEINWQAITDFETQKIRFDFIRLQEEELKNSLKDLDEAIQHIDVKSKQRFETAFNEVNCKFRQVFPIIFGGGDAELKVIGDLDDPECGVDIIARPPGKKMQNINLMSGGEKALTAVSLIFSIFLVKPSPFCLLDEVDAPLDDANVGRFNELLREMSRESQFILITHNKKTMELNDTLYGVTMQEPGISSAVSVMIQ